jgi:hypothetical protein
MIFDFGIELVWRVGTISSSNQNSRFKNPKSNINNFFRTEPKRVLIEQYWAPRPAVLWLTDGQQGGRFASRLAGGGQRSVGGGGGSGKIRIVQRRHLVKEGHSQPKSQKKGRTADETRYTHAGKGVGAGDSGQCDEFVNEKFKDSKEIPVVVRRDAKLGVVARAVNR